MKKLLITILTVVTAVSANAQQESSSVTPTKKMSVSEANTLNGNKQPTYQGGKSYSQWVSEEKAKQEGVNMKAVIPQVPEQFKSVAASWTGKPDAVKQPQTVVPQQEEYINKVNPTASKVQDPLIVVAKQEETKTIASVLPAALKGTSMDPDAKPVMKAIENSNPATVPQQNSGNTAVPAETKTTAQKTENTSADPKMIVPEEKPIKIQPAKIDPPKTEAAQLPANNEVKVATPTKKD